jgi:arsenate reductase-like glutaredoxin family protein
MATEIKLYGTERCHKSHHYKTFLDHHGLEYKFLDVEINSSYAEELKGLYSNRKLNFPTITLGVKKLRNPSDKELLKWLKKLK